MKTVLFLAATYQLVLMAPRNLLHVPDVVFPPVPDEGKTMNFMSIMRNKAALVPSAPAHEDVGKWR
jgi:hypothetical protein